MMDDGWDAFRVDLFPRAGIQFPRHGCKGVSGGKVWGKQYPCSQPGLHTYYVLSASWEPLCAVIHGSTGRSGSTDDTGDGQSGLRPLFAPNLPVVMPCISGKRELK